MNGILIVEDEVHVMGVAPTSTILRKTLWQTKSLILAFLFAFYIY